ncbi:hypothetical protein FJTKL_03417 [Diaporthe vaccinii]|uniref:Rhodopsin domain-containing protein n=1 Tax=Diaporthe vaccinii TaxID=105482 RepID=A0ABR4F237_9PEZI
MANNHDIVYMAPPPAGRPRFDGSPTRQFAMGLVSIVTTVIAFAVVALRILTRKYVVKMPMRVDDYFAVAAVIASILLVVSNAIQRDAGIGLHIWNVQYDDFTQSLQAWTIVATSFYCLAITFAKLSLLVLYLQLSPVKSFRISVWVLIVFVCGYSLAYILVMVFRCRPVAAAWDMTITGAECYSQVTVMLVLSIANILVDAALFILPLPVIAPLQMRIEKKVSLILLFATGGLVCAAATTRTVIMFAGVMQSADYTWDIIPTYYWCYIEVSAGIVCSSVPALRPMASRYLRPIFTSSRGRTPGAQAEEDTPRVPHSSALAINKKRRAARAEVYELKGRDVSSGLRNTKQEETVPHDDEERLWLSEGSRNDLELHEQSTTISNKGFRGTDGGSTSTLGGRSEKA